MVDIQFEEEAKMPVYEEPVEKKPLFVRWVLATGLASSDQQAQYVLIGVAVTATVLAILLPLVIK